MKKLVLITFSIILSIFSMAQNMVITAVYDGPLVGGHPKGIELYALSNIADLSIYGVGSANNGLGTDGQEFTFPAVSATMGQFIYLTADSTGFRDFMGFNADYTSGAMSINGDDAIELFTNGAVTDVFGDINIDGTGQPWEYLDGWVYRNNCTGPDDSTFVLSNWSYSGINVLDGETLNSTASSPIPIAVYSTVSCSSLVGVNFANTAYSANEGAGTAIVTYNLSAAATQADTIYLSSTDVTANDGVDFTTTPDVSSGMMKIVAIGDSSFTITVNITNDVIPEINETFTIDIDSVSSGLTVGGLNSTTFTIIDNDVVTSYPSYPIALVTTEDASGVADSLNTFCELTGIVYGENFRASSTGLSFTLIDNTGGIGCFTNPVTYGYTVAEGDSIVVQGNIGQYNGFTQIYLDTIILISGGHTLKTPATISSALGEPEESDLIRIDSVVILNPSQWTGTGSGFNVDVSDGTITYSMRIDNDCNLFSMPVPSYSFRLTGIGGQYDSTSAYLQNYQIYPRRDTDLDSLGLVPTVVIPNYPIATVNKEDQSGIADSLGVVCSLTGIVYGENFRASSTGFSFTLIDNTGGIGVFEGAGTVAYTVNEGDEVTVYGNIGQYNGLTQIYIDSLKVLSSGNGLKNPTVTTILGEFQESDLYKLAGVTIVTPADWDGLGSGFNVDVTDGTKTYTLRIDNDCELFSMPVPTGTLNVTGIGGQFDSTDPFTDGYQLLPRRASDIESIDGISSNLPTRIRVYPNPANDIINIDINTSSINAIKIIDMAGKTVVKTINTKVSVEYLEAGLYFVEVNSTEGTYRTKFIKK